MTLLIQNARCWNGGGFHTADVLLQGGKIKSLGTSISSDGVNALFDARGQYFLIPGFVDVHVHLREPGFSYKETIATGSGAAAAAGYTTVFAMPNLTPAPDTPAHLAEEQAIIDRDAKIQVLPFASITKGRKGSGELVDFEALSPKVVGFSDDGCGVQDEGLMREAMVRCKALNKVISAHCEVNDLLNGGYIHDGAYCKAHGHRGISSASEWKMIERDCRLASDTGCRYHVCHISTKESVEVIREAKKSGVPVTCETGPHYLVLCDEDLQEDGRFKMNPPLRSRSDREALLEGVADGTVDVIATDHAPHLLSEKEGGALKAMSGMPMIQFSLVSMLQLVDEGVFTLETIVEKMCHAPAQIYRINERGYIREGYRADLVLVRPDTPWEVTADKVLSKCGWSPLEGHTFNWKVERTFANGHSVYSDGMVDDAYRGEELRFGE